MEENVMNFFQTLLGACSVLINLQTIPEPLEGRVLHKNELLLWAVLCYVIGLATSKCTYLSRPGYDIQLIGRQSNDPSR
jgi:hypothetical protein